MKACCEEHGISVATFYNRMNRTKNKSCIHPQPVLEDETLEEQNIVPLSIIDNDSCIEDHVPFSGYDPAVTLTIGRCHVVIHNHILASKTTFVVTLAHIPLCLIHQQSQHKSMVEFLRPTLLRRLSPSFKAFEGVQGNPAHVVVYTPWKTT